MDRLVKKAEEALIRNGFSVFYAACGAAACDYLAKLAGKGPAVKSRSATLKAIGLAEHFSRLGIRLTETGLADFLAAGEGFSPEKAKSFIREQTAGATLGITGANAVIAETGSIAIVEDEGNARLVSGLPPVHAVVVTGEKIVPTMAEALRILEGQSRKGGGRPRARYLSFISGPSKTGDIGFQLVKGMHGPGEVHVILLPAAGRKQHP